MAEVSSGVGRTPARWLWVAGPDYYLDADEQDRRDLEPGAGFVPDAWWTCAPGTRQGDTALLYRSQVRKNIAHVMVARSDAEVLDLPGSPFDGKHICQYEVVDKLDRPVDFATIATDPTLRDWPAVKARFVRSFFPVPAAMWSRLLELANEDEQAVDRQAVDGIKRIRLEKQIQKRLAAHPHLLAEHGLRELELVKSEFYFPDGLHADLVFTRGRGILRHFVVVELKRGLVGPRAVDQVIGYRDRLDRRRGGPARTCAVLIGERLHPDAVPLIKTTRRLTFIPLSELKIEWDRTSA